MRAGLMARAGLGVALALGMVVGPAAADTPGGSASAAPASQVQQATRRAQQYLRTQPFSRSGLIDQLVYEGFSRRDASNAVDRLRVNWNKQAEAKGRQYLRVMAMSQAQLLDQLRYEGFTESQVGYGRRHIYPSTKQKPVAVPTSSERVPYSKTQDICVAYSGSGVATLVTKATSCDFAANVLDGYEKNAPRSDRSRARKTVTFKAYSPATHKRYTAKCAPQRYTRDVNNWRYRVVSCRSGQAFRAKIDGWYRVY